MTRAPCCEKTEVRKGPWTPEEDELLVKCINEHGEGNWSTIPKKAGLVRCGKSCRLRWANYLRPDLKRGAFSSDEESLIVRLHQEMGNRWAKIALELPGRTDNDIKNHWNTRIKKRLRESGVDPETHLPLSASRLMLTSAEPAEAAGQSAKGKQAALPNKRPLPATTSADSPQKKQCVESLPVSVTTSEAQQRATDAKAPVMNGSVKAEVEGGAAAASLLQQQLRSGGRMGFRSSSCSSSSDEDGDSMGPSLEHDVDVDAPSPTSVIVSDIAISGRAARGSTVVSSLWSGAATGVSAGCRGASLLSSPAVAPVVSSSPKFGASRLLKAPPPALIIPCPASLDEGEAEGGEVARRAAGFAVISVADGEEPKAEAVEAPTIGGGALSSPFMLRNSLWNSSDLNCPWGDELETMDMGMDASSLPVLPSPKFIPLTPSGAGFTFNAHVPATAATGNNNTHSNTVYNTSYISYNSCGDWRLLSGPTEPTGPGSMAGGSASALLDSSLVAAGSVMGDLTAFDTLPQPLSDCHVAGSGVSSSNRRLGGFTVRSVAKGADRLVQMSLLSPPLPGTTFEPPQKPSLQGTAAAAGGVVESSSSSLAPVFDSFDLGLPPGVCPSPLPGFAGGLFSPLPVWQQQYCGEQQQQ